MGRIKIGGILLSLLFLFSCDIDLTTEIINEVSEAVNPKYSDILVSRGGTVFNNHDTELLGQCDSGTSQQYIFSISNGGNTDLVLPVNESERLVLTPDTVFSIDSWPSTTIPAGGIRDFTLRFSPPGNVEYEALLTISSNDPDFPEFILTLQAEGVPPLETPAPEGLSATDGASESSITLNWEEVGTADYYQVFRSTELTIPAIAYEAQVFGESYTDNTAEVGVLYRYWVEAYSSLGWSDPSDPDTGYRKLSASTSVSAGLGLSTTYIRVSWTEITGADSYEIYRSTSTTAPSDDIDPADLTYAGVVGTQKDDDADNATVVPGKKIYYWVRGRSEVSDSLSAWTRSSSYGYKKLSAVVLSAYSGSDTGWDVRLSWAAVDGADSYYIYSATSSGVGTGNLHTPSTNDELNPTTTSPYYDYQDGETTSIMYYRVCPYASDTTMYGDLSNEVHDYRGYPGG